VNQEQILHAFVYVGVPVASAIYHVSRLIGDHASAELIKAEYMKPGFPDVGSAFN
jgi:hypothetical protein